MTEIEIRNARAAEYSYRCRRKQSRRRRQVIAAAQKRIAVSAFILLWVSVLALLVGFRG